MEKAVPTTVCSLLARRNTECISCCFIFLFMGLWRLFIHSREHHRHLSLFSVIPIFFTRSLTLLFRLKTALGELGCVGFDHWHHFSLLVPVTAVINPLGCFRRHQRRIPKSSNTGTSWTSSVAATGLSLSDSWDTGGRGGGGYKRVIGKKRHIWKRFVLQQGSSGTSPFFPSDTTTLQYCRFVHCGYCRPAFCDRLQVETIRCPRSIICKSEEFSITILIRLLLTEKHSLKLESPALEVLTKLIAKEGKS